MHPVPRHAPSMPARASQRSDRAVAQTEPTVRRAPGHFRRFSGAGCSRRGQAGEGVQLLGAHARGAGTEAGPPRRRRDRDRRKRPGPDDRLKLQTPDWPVTDSERQRLKYFWET